MPQSLWQQKCGFSLNHSSEDEGDTASRSEPTEVTTNITLEDELSTLSIQDDIPSPQEHHPPQEPYKTKSGRISKPPERLAFKALLEPYDYLEHDTFQDKHPLAFKAKSDPDSMYYHQAMKQTDREKFIEAIEKDFYATLAKCHVDNLGKANPNKLDLHTLLYNPVSNLEKVLHADKYICVSP